MIENEAKTNPRWQGWPSEDDLAVYSEIGLTSLPYGTEVEEQFPLDDAPRALPAEDAAAAGVTATWDAAASRFGEDDAQRLLERLCAIDGLDAAATSRPDSRAVVLGEERRLAFQPGVPLWVLAWREAVSRSRAWGAAEAIRSQLAGVFYRSFLRGWFADPAKDWAESSDVWLEHLYKSCATHGNGRSKDLGDRPELLPKNWCGAAASAVLVEALRRGGFRLKIAHDFSDLVYRKDWNLAVTEYGGGGRPPPEPFIDDASEEPKPRAGDILTLALANKAAPPEGHFAMVLATRMEAPDRGFAYVASGSTGPLRTVAVDLFRIEPRDPAYRHPYPPDMPRPRPGSAWMLELNRTSLLLPTRRLKTWSKDGLRQLKVEEI